MSQRTSNIGIPLHTHSPVPRWRTFTRWISGALQTNPRRSLARTQTRLVASIQTNTPHLSFSTPTSPSREGYGSHSPLYGSTEADSSSLPEWPSLTVPSTPTSLHRTSHSAEVFVAEPTDATVKAVLPIAAATCISTITLVESISPGTSHASPTTSEDGVWDLSGLVTRGRMTYSGTYSDVYQGRCGSQVVAIKVIKSLPSEPLSAVRRRMRREVRTSSRFDHPNVLAVYGVIDAEWCPFGGIVTIWCPNGDASEYIRRGQLTDFARLQMVRDVTAGLEYIHSLSVVHGDLKPGNILIDALGNPLICDFGLVHILDTEQPKWVADNTTTLHPGTVRYLACELVTDPPGLRSMASDMHALGCVAYESLYIETPYSERSGNNAGFHIFQDITDGVPPAYRPLMPLSLVVSRIWDLLEWCWTKDYDRRPDVMTFRSSIEKLVGSDFQLQPVEYSVPQPEEYTDVYSPTTPPPDAPLSLSQLPVPRNGPVSQKTSKEFSFQLPVELLRAIFEEYLRLDLPVQVLLQVNTQWRAIALEAYRPLWRRLLLSADAIPGTLRAGSVHACASEGQTTRILNRSGNITKLEVAFVLGPKEGDTPTPEMRASLFKTVGHSALHRISFLCIIVNPEMTLPLVNASLSDVFLGDLPCLESLMIASVQAIGNLYEPLSALMDIIEASSEKLKSLYLENVSKDFILRASTKKFWTRLIRITIRSEFDSLDAELFSLPPSLEFFSFSGELVATPAPFTAHLDSALKTKIEFPELKWLRVSLISMATLARLNLPKLHTMAIDCVQGNYPAPAPPLGTLLLPALKVLQIATVNPTIACINAPNLDTLCLSIPTLKQTDADNVLKAVFYGGEGMMKPKYLTLRGPVHDKYLVAMLRLLGEKLVSLELDSQMPFSKKFWVEMTPRATARRGFRAAVGSIISSVTAGTNPSAGAVSTGGVTTATNTAGRVAGSGGRRYRPLLLPNLRYLVVDVHKNPMAQEEGREMRILLMKLIEGRRGNDQYESLLRLACKWRKGPGVEEVVHPPTCLSYADRSMAVDMTPGTSHTVLKKDHPD